MARSNAVVVADPFTEVEAPETDITSEVVETPKPIRRAAIKSTDVIDVVGTDGAGANPQRAGTKGFAYFALLSSGMTISAAIEAGCARHALNWFIAHGTVTIR